MSKISRRDFLKVTGIAAAAAALTACGGSSSTASSAAASSEVVKKLDKISVAVPNDTSSLLAHSPEMGLPEDIASAALFLASDESHFVNGTTITCDGGWRRTASSRSRRMLA